MRTFILSIKDFLLENNLPSMFSIKYAINCCEYALTQTPTHSIDVLNALDLAKRYRDGDSTVTAQMLRDAAANAGQASCPNNAVHITAHYASYAAANAANAASYVAYAAANAAYTAASDEIQWQILKDLLNSEYSEVEQLILGLKI